MCIMNKTGVPEEEQDEKHTERRSFGCPGQCRIKAVLRSRNHPQIRFIRSCLSSVPAYVRQEVDALCG